MDISLLYQSIQSSTLNTLTPSAIDSVRVQLRHNCTVTETLPLRSHPRPFYVDITAKAPGYMDVLAFYSFLRKNLISRCQRKAIFHLPHRPVYMHVDVLVLTIKRLLTHGLRRHSNGTRAIGIAGWVIY